MQRSDYPKFTIIMRGYTYPQAEAILLAMKGYEDQFAVEMTLNTPDALSHIRKLKERFGETIHIGAGTVRTYAEAEAAIAAGAVFLLGPHTFTKEMLALSKEAGVLAVPAAMTPSEIHEMFAQGADIVKVFPAAVVTPRFFKDVQAPLGKLPLMGVGGVSVENAAEFLENGASYLGFGSGLFHKQDIETLNVAQLAASLRQLAASV